MRRCVTIAAASLAAMISLSSPATADDGPLNPPAGPIASTPGPEPRREISLTNTPGDADSFFRITAGGSYYLPKAFEFTAAEINGKSGIEVDADNVTIDLDGFELRGVSGALHAIRINPGRRGVTIRNGHLDTWGRGGVTGEASAQVIIDDLDIHSVGIGATGSPGISVNSGSILRNVTITAVGGATTQAGVAAGNNCVLDRIAVTQTNGGGIGAGAGSEISNCTVWALSGTGISLGASCRVHGSSVSQCTGDGIAGGGAVNVVDCNLDANTGAGVHVGSFSLVQGCVAQNNGGTGLQVDFRSRVIGSVASGNQGNGFLVSDWGFISGCRADGNTLDGINTGGGGGQVSDCTCTGNSDDGIDVGTDVTVRGCTCDNNTQAGIHVTAQSDARVDGNTCTDNARGIDVDTGGNIIIRNMCSGNSTNYDIVTGNVVGVVVSSPLSGAVLGSAGGIGVGTTDPAANLSY
jgi:parallel beta-helix repeat protein